MIVYERICCSCGVRYGCKWLDETGLARNNDCSDCLFSMFPRNCLEDVEATLDITHGICNKCKEEVMKWKGDSYLSDATTVEQFTDVNMEEEE